MADQHERFLRTICERPDDDTPRLIFADWLEEQGQEQRAQWIRVQIELAKLDKPASATQFKVGNEVRFDYELCMACAELEEGQCRWHALKEVEDNLWWSFYPHTVPGGVPDWLKLFPDYPTEICNQHEKHCTRSCVPEGAPLHLLLTWRRGFPASVDCHQEAWLKWGPQIVQRAPVVDISLCDRAPLRYHDEAAQMFWWMWLCYPGGYYATAHSSSHLSVELYRWQSIDAVAGDNHCRYPSKEEALRALRRACLCQARHEAGLPPLTFRSASAVLA